MLIVSGNFQSNAIIIVVLLWFDHFPNILDFELLLFNSVEIKYNKENGRCLSSPNL